MVMLAPLRCALRTIVSQSTKVSTGSEEDRNTLRVEPSRPENSVGTREETSSSPTQCLYRNPMTHRQDSVSK